jgi:hypothetical protein
MTEFWKEQAEKLEGEVAQLARARSLSERQAWEEVYREPKAVPTGERFPVTTSVVAYMVLTIFAEEEHV